MAIGVLELFDNVSNESENFQYLSSEIEMFDYSCNEIAVVGNCYNFVATTCVQNYLTTVWYGGISTNPNLLTKLKVI